MALDDPATTLTYGARRDRPEELVRAHMPLVRKIAWHVHGRVSSAIEVADLVQIGMIALVEAAAAYEDRGHAFATYASMRIRGAMIDQLRRMVGTARSAIGHRRAIAEARAALEAVLGRPPGDGEMAERMGMSAADYRELVDMTMPTQHVAIDEVYADHLPWFADTGESADAAIDRERMAGLLAGAIAKLPEREALVLQLYFVEELNLAEIAETMGVGSARVCQIKKAGLDRLKAILADLV